MTGPDRHSIWLDGGLVDARGPHLNVTDRGFQLGDGLFETARARRGVVIELDEHLERLRTGCAALGFNLGLGDDQLADAIAELLAAEELDGTGSTGRPVGDAAIRLTLSRGPFERRGLLPAGFETLVATVAIQAWPYVPASPELLERGVRAVTSALRRDPGSPLAGVKTSSRADYVYARLEADRAGADDALLLTLDGHVSEASAANLFVLTGDRLTTPPLSAAILAGTTRTWLLNHAERLGLIASEVDLEPAEVLRADEAFLTGSVAGIVPLVALDGQAVGGGQPGPRGRALRAAREAWIDAMSMAALLPPEPDDQGS
ncbi:MAG TPA: aminotransferase class IV [Candidatus Limnocylindrales bacterium]